jgi:hypothetical protein
MPASAHNLRRHFEELKAAALQAREDAQTASEAAAQTLQDRREASPTTQPPPGPQNG